MLISFSDWLDSCKIEKNDHYRSVLSRDQRTSKITYRKILQIPVPDKIRNKFVSCGVMAMKETAEGLGVGLCTFQGSIVIITS